MSDPVPLQRDLLHLLASAFVDLSEREAPGEPVYSLQVQRAYNLLVLACLRAKVEPPASVPALVRLAATAAPSEWGLGLDLSELLIDPVTRTPTDACREWHLPYPDPLAERHENEIMLTALTRCREAEDPGAYVAFRRLLVERPVLTGAELDDLLGDFELFLLADLLPSVYLPATAAHRGPSGDFAICAGCGCLLRPAAGGWACELDRCRDRGAARVGSALSAARRPHQLTAPMRLFITGPGLVEIDLERLLTGLGLTVEMWPAFDAYDVRVTFPDGTVWAIDAKDRADARLLARTLPPPVRLPAWNRFFLVVPDRRLTGRIDYRERFRRHCRPEVAAELTMCGVTELVASAAARPAVGHA
ncbi:restriction endonuclease-related protein [Phytomonospora endophytica]|uniref:REase associating with pPIWI RE domain-containing protein n=1 Tax=Phytomonospora endophytica TaxID=714109 RepID=A0A841FJX7_9ACTN|nr:hypothetical protein [Phytomonospora endophytica]MBB6032939.1 hypothetical protein [Phytomonospora endophytica]GIG65165.1 hypothetical protein Pen01_14600 [Phytomonospora endophytica]